MQICQGKIDVGNNAFQVTVSKPCLYIKITLVDFVCSFVLIPRPRLIPKDLHLIITRWSLGTSISSKALQMILKCSWVWKATKDTFLKNVLL